MSKIPVFINLLYFIKNKIEYIGLFEKKRKDAVKTCIIKKV
jgi:hypothetical protein